MTFVHNIFPFHRTLDLQPSTLQSGTSSSLCLKLKNPLEENCARERDGHISAIVNNNRRANHNK